MLAWSFDFVVFIMAVQTTVEGNSYLGTIIASLINVNIYFTQQKCI